MCTPPLHSRCCRWRCLAGGVMIAGLSRRYKPCRPPWHSRCGWGYCQAGGARTATLGGWIRGVKNADLGGRHTVVALDLCIVALLLGFLRFQTCCGIKFFVGHLKESDVSCVSLGHLALWCCPEEPSGGSYRKWGHHFESLGLFVLRLYFTIMGVARRSPFFYPLYQGNHVASTIVYRENSVDGFHLQYTDWEVLTLSPVKPC